MPQQRCNREPAGASPVLRGSVKAASAGTGPQASQFPVPAANELSAMLWDERRHLAELLSCVDAAVSLQPGPGEAMAAAPDMTEEKMQNVRAVGLARALATDDLCRSWGLPEDPALPELIAHVPAEPWGFIFSSHLDAMADLLNQIDQLDLRRGRRREGPVTGRPGQDPPAAADADGVIRSSGLAPRALRHFITGRRSRTAQTSTED